MLPAGVKAILFDLDGTLYDARRLRAWMALALLRAWVGDPRGTAKAVSVLREYRHAHEAVRRQELSGHPGTLQLELAARRTAVGVDEIRSIVRTWMEQKPLRFLARCMRPGLVEFLEAARSEGVRLAVLSDYPAEEKLVSIGIRQYFDVVACAQDQEIARLKPNPTGLTVVATKLNVSASEAVYIGDRPEVDGEAARRAGMLSVIVGRGGLDFRQLVRQWPATNVPKNVAAPGMLGPGCGPEVQKAEAGRVATDLLR